MAALLPLQGKKVVWTGFDPETQAMTILFEDKTGIHIEGTICEVADVEQFIDATLAENAGVAKQILKLEALYPKVTPAPEPTADEPAKGEIEGVVNATAVQRDALAVAADAAATESEFIAHAESQQ